MTYKPILVDPSGVATLLPVDVTVIWQVARIKIALPPLSQLLAFSTACRACLGVAAAREWRIFRVRVISYTINPPMLTNHIQCRCPTSSLPKKIVFAQSQLPVTMLERGEGYVCVRVFVNCKPKITWRRHVWKMSGMRMWFGHFKLQTHANGLHALAYRLNWNTVLYTKPNWTSV